MYVRVGRFESGIPTEVPDLTWNPPGWGSASINIPGTALAMVVGIRPGGFIPFHRDNPAAENGLDGRTLVRSHVVLATNDHCWNFHDGTWQQLKPGVRYQMDPALEHASINLGDSVRLHLVIDEEVLSGSET